MLILIIIILLILLFYLYRKKENLAPMLKRALEGEELSYQSNIGPGFFPS
jgi:predicted PurR-regulated permease PerM